MAPSNPTPRTGGRLAAVVGSRRNRTIAALVGAALLLWLFAGLGHHGTGQPRTSRTVPLLSPVSTASPSATPAASASASRPAASPTQAGDDGPGSDSNPASDTTPSPITITSGPVNPTDAAVTFLARYLNTGGSAKEWRSHAETGDDGRPLVTADLAAQLEQADPTRVPLGIIDQSSAVMKTVGDGQVTVTLRLVASHTDPKVVDTIVVWLDGTSHRWLAAQLDEIKPQVAS